MGFNIYPALHIKQPDLGRALLTAAAIKSSGLKNRLALRKADREDNTSRLRAAAIGSLSGGGQAAAGGGAGANPLAQYAAPSAASGFPAPTAAPDLSQYAGPSGAPTGDQVTNALVAGGRPDESGETRYGPTTQAASALDWQAQPRSPMEQKYLKIADPKEGPLILQKLSTMNDEELEEAKQRNGQRAAAAFHIEDTPPEQRPMMYAQVIGNLAQRGWNVGFMPDQYQSGAVQRQIKLATHLDDIIGEQKLAWKNSRVKVIGAKGPRYIDPRKLPGQAGAGQAGARAPLDLDTPAMREWAAADPEGASKYADTRRNLRGGKRRIAEDAAGLKRYTDTGERVFPGTKKGTNLSVPQQRSNDAGDQARAYFREMEAGLPEGTSLSDEIQRRITSTDSFGMKRSDYNSFIAQMARLAMTRKYGGDSEQDFWMKQFAPLSLPEGAFKPPADTAKSKSKFWQWFARQIGGGTAGEAPQAAQPGLFPTDSPEAAAPPGTGGPASGPAPQPVPGPSRTPARRDGGTANTGTDVPRMEGGAIDRSRLVPGQNYSAKHPETGEPMTVRWNGKEFERVR